MSKNPKEAYDKGYRDGRSQAKCDRECGVLGDLFHNHYHQDKDYPQSYKAGFREAKQDASKK